MNHLILIGILLILSSAQFNPYASFSPSYPTPRLSNSAQDAKDRVDATNKTLQSANARLAEVDQNITRLRSNPLSNSSSANLANLSSYELDQLQTETTIKNKKTKDQINIV